MADRPILWKNLAYGMSLDEVRAVVPEAQDNPSPSQLSTGTTNLLVVPGLSLSHTPFQVHLYFKDGQLEQVNLECQATAGKDLFESLFASLTQRYGSPVKQSPGLAVTMTEWLSEDGVNVLLLLMGDLGILKVVYQARSLKDAESL